MPYLILRVIKNPKMENKPQNYDRQLPHESLYLNSRLRFFSNYGNMAIKYASFVHGWVDYWTTRNKTLPKDVSTSNVPGNNDPIKLYTHT